MKKTILISLFFAFTSMCLAEGKPKSILIIKENGGSMGYDDVKETHDDEGNYDMYELTCYDPGDDVCQFNKYDPVVVGTPVMVVHMNIHTQIKNGVLSGSATFDNVSVTWSGKDKFNYTITMIYND